MKNNMSILKWSADTCQTVLNSLGEVPGSITGPAIENLRGELKAHQKIVYLGQTQYTSPLGAIFDLHTYVMINK